jgi:predicted RNA-binding Zn-ribbon protein involved in translation (DUF1610 family)
MVDVNNNYYLTRQILIETATHDYILSGKTKNITDAVKMLLSEQRPIFKGLEATITHKEDDKPNTVIDNYKRPLCPSCGESLFLKSRCSGLRPNDNFYIWTCKACDYEDYTDLTLPEILATLKPKAG